MLLKAGVSNQPDGVTTIKINCEYVTTIEKQ